MANISIGTPWSVGKKILRTGQSTDVLSSMINSNPLMLRDSKLDLPMYVLPTAAVSHLKASLHRTDLVSRLVGVIYISSLPVEEETLVHIFILCV
jgi:hypothetical protein